MRFPDTRLLGEAFRTWLDRNAFQHAGSLAFFTLFSLAPLVIILVAIVGAVFGREAATGEIAANIRSLVGPQAASAVQAAVSRSRPDQAGILPMLLGIGALVFGATTVFSQMQASLNHFWGVRARPSRAGILHFLLVRLLSLGMVLIIGFLLLVSTVGGLALFGVHGLVIGPLVAALFLAAWSLLDERRESGWTS